MTLNPKELERCEKKSLTEKFRLGLYMSFGYLRNWDTDKYNQINWYIKVKNICHFFATNTHIYAPETSYITFRAEACVQAVTVVLKMMH